jgi:hypothetical protein
MAPNEKPHVDVPADQPPSYQLELDDLEVGEGEEAVAGRIVEVHYVGVSWKTGKQFDASWDRGRPFKFGLGKGQVIAGWDQGVAGMRSAAGAASPSRRTSPTASAARAASSARTRRSSSWWTWVGVR